MDAPVGNAVQSRPAFSWLVFIASSVMLLFVAAVLLFYVPRFKEIFVDFHLKLPAATQLLLEVSDAASSPAAVIFLLVPVLLGWIVPRLSSRIVDRSSVADLTALRRLVAFLIVLCFTLTVILVISLVVMAPLLALIRGLGSNKR